MFLLDFLNDAKRPEGVTARDFARRRRLSVEAVLELARICAQRQGLKTTWRARPEGGQEGVYTLPTQEKGAACSPSF